MSFLLPLLWDAASKRKLDRHTRGPLAFILAPTRELAQQVILAPTMEVAWGLHTMEYASKDRLQTLGAYLPHVRPSAMPEMHAQLSNFRPAFLLPSDP